MHLKYTLKYRSWIWPPDWNHWTLVALNEQQLIQINIRRLPSKTTQKLISSSCQLISFPLNFTLILLQFTNTRLGTDSWTGCEYQLLRSLLFWRHLTSSISPRVMQCIAHVTDIVLNDSQPHLQVPWGHSGIVISVVSPRRIQRVVLLAYRIVLSNSLYRELKTAGINNIRRDVNGCQMEDLGFTDWCWARELWCHWSARPDLMIC